MEREGFYSPLASTQALIIGGYHAVGNANNTQALVGDDGGGARGPPIHSRFGFVQRTSVYWPTGHEATDNSPGVAVLTGRTAYEPFQTRRAGVPPANRPGVPPAILTWAEAKSLAEFMGDLRSLRARADIVVASHHWGLFEEVTIRSRSPTRRSMRRRRGHGSRTDYACAVEMYRDKPIFYGLGSFSFHTGHGGRAHGDWVGMLARLTFDDSALVEVAFSMVRHDERNETYVCNPRQDEEAVEQIMRRCDKLGHEPRRLAVDAPGQGGFPSGCSTSDFPWSQVLLHPGTLGAGTRASPKWSRSVVPSYSRRNNPRA